MSAFFVACSHFLVVIHAQIPLFTRSLLCISFISPVFTTEYLFAKGKRQTKCVCTFSYDTVMPLFFCEVYSGFRNLFMKLLTVD